MTPTHRATSEPGPLLQRNPSEPEQKINESDLQKWVCVLQKPSSHRVTGFVICYRLLLLRLQNLCLLLQTFIRDHNKIRAWSWTMGPSLVSTKTWTGTQSALSLKVVLRAVGSGHPGHSPPITLSMACSKCFWLMASERWRAAMSAASLQTFAMSAPGGRKKSQRTAEEEEEKE